MLLVDSHPTMGVWSEAVETLAAELQSLDLGTVDQRPFGLGGAVPEIGTETSMIVIATDGAARAWQSARTAKTLRAWASRVPTVVAHMLSQPRWQQTAIDPQPVEMRRDSPSTPNSSWGWVPGGITATDGDAVAIPVVEAGTRGIRHMARLLRTEGRAVPVAAMLVRARADAARGDEPRARDARAVVDAFRASVTPMAFRLATLLAAVPLDLSVMQGVQRRLLPRSTVENLSEVLVSPLVHADQAPPGKSLKVGFRFAKGVQDELLATARRSDMARVGRAARSSTPASPGADRFASILTGETADLRFGTGTDHDQFAQRDHDAWREALAHVFLALGGPYFHEGQEALDALSRRNPSKAPPALTPHRPTSSTTGSVEGLPMTQTEQQARTGDAGPSVEGLGAVIGEYPLRNNNFTGREGLLEQLHSSLSSSSSPTAVLPQALHGMGGVGKSLLANEYIHRHQNDYEVIWWIPAERTTRIQSSLMDLGRRLGLPIVSEANASVPVVLDALRRGEPYGNWLLVFDNAESPEHVQPFLPNGGPGHILITSRDNRWSQLAQPLEVDVFTREESKQLLHRRGPDISDDDAERLAEALGDLPLAIEQAAAWHAETGMSADEYLRLLRDKQAELLEQSAPLDYQRPVIAAWNVSLDRLQERSPEAVQLLQVCSFFAAEPIPRTLFAAARSQDLTQTLNGALRDQIRFGNALRAINRYSLARFDHRTQAIQMHRLVQVALIARMTEDERDTFRHAAHKILTANDPTDPENPLEYDTYGNLYPHVRASEAVDCDDSWVRGLVINEAMYLYRWGDHDASARLCREAYELWSTRFGPDDPQTLVMARWFGFVLFAIGEYEEAAALNTATLQVHQDLKDRGEEDVDGELLTLTNVAIDRRAQGRFGEALRISEEVYERSLRRYGDEMPDTLNAAHNLGVSLRLAGQFQAARERDEETYRLKLNVLQADHPLTMFTLLGLLVDRRELGEYLEVERLHIHELNRARHAFGEVNPVTLLARRLLAVAQRKAGNHEAALETSALVLKQLQQRYGPLHPETMAAASTHAIDLRQVARVRDMREMLEDARQRGEEIVRLYTRALEADHPHTLTAQVNLAITHRLTRDAAKALDLDVKAHEALARLLGENHPSTLAAAINRSSDYWAVGMLDEAVALSADTYPRLVTVFGPEHPTTLACESNYGIDLRSAGREEEALERKANATSILATRLGAGHPFVVQARSWDYRADCDLDPMPL